MIAVPGGIRATAIFDGDGDACSHSQGMNFFGQPRNPLNGAVHEASRLVSRLQTTAFKLQPAPKWSHLQGPLQFADSLKLHLAAFPAQLLVFYEFSRKGCILNGWPGWIADTTIALELV